MDISIYKLLHKPVHVSKTLKCNIWNVHILALIKKNAKYISCLIFAIHLILLTFEHIFGRCASFLTTINILRLNSYRKGLERQFMYWKNASKSHIEYTYCAEIFFSLLHHGTCRWGFLKAVTESIKSWTTATNCLGEIIETSLQRLK